MSMTDGFRTYLVAQAPITAIVGSTNPRVFGGNIIPQDEDLPAITYWEAGTDHRHHFGGASGFAFVQLRVDCWAETRTGARTLAEAVRAELQGYRGAMGSANVRCCHAMERSNAYFPPESGDKVGRYLVPWEFRIGYVESIPTF